PSKMGMGLLSQTLSSGRWATNSRFSDCVWPFAEEECKRSTISLKAGCFTLIPGAAPVSAGSQVRNSFSDSCDVTVKTGADLAKTRKSQVTFAAFNSTKITSVYSAFFRKDLLAQTYNFPGSSYA